MDAETSQTFHLKIIEQTWSEMGPPEFDLWSLGRLWLEVHGEVILDGREFYGVSESALALLRTLDHDHTPQQSLAEKLILHGCGTVLMMGCSIGVNWSVIHQEEQVILKDFQRWDSPDELHPRSFPGLEVALPFMEYEVQVLNFAQQVKEFFKEEQKKFFDEQEHQAYEQFWLEFNERLNQHKVKYQD